MTIKKRAEEFVTKLKALEDEYNLKIDHHADYCSLLKCTDSGEIVAYLLSDDSYLDLLDKYDVE